MRFCLEDSSENITAIAGKVLGVTKGGNTATAVKPAGIKATAEAPAGLATTFGDPPPPGDPGGGDPGGALPAPIAGGAGITSIMVTAMVTATAAADRTIS